MASVGTSRSYTSILRANTFKAFTSSSAPVTLRTPAPINDSVALHRFYDKYRKGGRKLVELCGHYGVDDAEMLHDAQRDVEACVAVLLKQCAKYPEMLSMSLDLVYISQQGWHRDWADNLSKYLVSKGGDPLSVSDLSWPLDPVT